MFTGPIFRRIIFNGKLLIVVQGKDSNENRAQANIGLPFVVKTAIHLPSAGRLLRLGDFLPEPEWLSRAVGELLYRKLQGTRKDGHSWKRTVPSTNSHPAIIRPWLHLLLGTLRGATKRTGCKSSQLRWEEKLYA